MLEKSMNQELLSINNEFPYKIGIYIDLSVRGCQVVIRNIKSKVDAMYIANL